MTVEEMAFIFGNEDCSCAEYGKFDRVTEKNRLHLRPDICGMLILDRLSPGDSDMVTAAEHDEIWFDVNAERVAANATKDDILDIIRCGLRWDDDVESFTSFV